MLNPAHARSVAALSFRLTLALIRAMLGPPIPAITRQVIDAGVLVEPDHCIAGAGWGCVGSWDCADQGGGEDQGAHGAGISA